MRELDPINKPVVGLAVPKKEVLDRLHEATEAGLGLVPFAGSAVAGAFKAIIAKPLDKKMEQFLELLASQMVSMQTDINDLREALYSESFAASTVQAVQIAQHTVGLQKLQSLRNAAINTALLRPSEDRRVMFFNTLQSQAPVHLALLSFFGDPVGYLAGMARADRDYPFKPNSGNAVLVQYVFRDYDEEFLKIAVTDLYNTGLIRGVKMGIEVRNGRFNNILTKYGEEFLQFVSDPRIASLAKEGIFS